ncbi:MAG TPA: hypothetical protein V6D19_17630 [Stenomitos sp.]
MNLRRRKVFLDGAKLVLGNELSLPKALRQELYLTDRELDVLRLLSESSMTDRAIA